MKVVVGKDVASHLNELDQVQDEQGTGEGLMDPDVPGTGGGLQDLGELGTGGDFGVDFGEIDEDFVGIGEGFVEIDEDFVVIGEDFEADDHDPKTGIHNHRGLANLDGFQI